MLFNIIPLARVAEGLASPRFTIFNFLLLILSALLIKPLELETLGFISISLGFMFMNLLFCFIKKRGFSTWPVTMFHIAFLFFIAASGFASLFYFYGYIELAEGQRDGVQRFVKGVFHQNRLSGVRLLQGELDMRYSGKDLTGMKSALSFEEPDGTVIPVNIEFLKSFSLRGYSFYLHRERGYAVKLEYQDDFKKKSGFVDFPDYIGNSREQTKYFDIPGEELGFVASLNFNVPDPFSGEWTLDIPQKATLTLERGGESHTMAPGDSAHLKAGAVIKFLGVSRWANYVVYKNSFGPLMAVSGGAASIALLLHLLARMMKMKRKGAF